jgi:hypothetical protein
LHINMQCYRTSPFGRDVQLGYLSSPLVRGGDHNPAISADKEQCSHLDTNSVLQVSTTNLTSDGSCDYVLHCEQILNHAFKFQPINCDDSCDYWTMYLLRLH